ncbi:hypothetical protein HYW46_06645 [Candidatus Daviesbacteria bacterium]|nr:hypothetical protein [Candidatus Daviesbacteria bacterium]
MPEYFEKDLLTPELPSSIDPEKELPNPIKPAEELPAEDVQQSDPFFDYDPVRTLLSWKAPSRPFRKKDRSFYTTVAVLIVLTSMIVFLAGEKILVGAILALGFLVYVLNFISPEDVGYKISTQGVTIGDHFYHWQELDSFWFSEKDGHKLLHVLTRINFPGVLILVLGSDVSEEEVRNTCARYLPFHEIAPKTMMEKWSDSLQKHFPLENPHR